MKMLTNIAKDIDNLSIVLSGIDLTAINYIFRFAVENAMKTKKVIHILTNDGKSDGYETIKEIIPKGVSVYNGNKINPLPDTFDFDNISQLQRLLKAMGLSETDAPSLISHFSLLSEIEKLQGESGKIDFSVMETYAFAPNAALIIANLDNLSNDEKTILQARFGQNSALASTFISTIRAYSANKEKMDTSGGNVYIYNLAKLEAGERNIIADMIIRNEKNSSVIIIDRGSGDKKFISTLAAASLPFTYITQNVFSLDKGLFTDLTSCVDIILFSKQEVSAAEECEKYFGSVSLPKVSHSVQIDKSDHNVFHKLWDKNKVVTTQRHIESAPRYPNRFWTSLSAGDCVYSSKISSKTYGKLHLKECI